MEDAGHTAVKAEKDMRKVLGDKAVHAVWMATPDHWHAPGAILAADAGKHVYVEKPCSHNPWEGETLVAAARKYKRHVQMGNQRRSFGHYQQAIQKVHIGNPCGQTIIGKRSFRNPRQTTRPPELDRRARARSSR